MLAYYISGHGFGHASRAIEVLNALWRLRPELRVTVRTAVPRWLFARTLDLPVDLRTVECDTGIVQLDALRPDEDATIARAAAFYAGFEDRVDQEARFLEGTAARAVAGDIPPLAFAAAARAGVRSLAVGNFTWDWIYEDYLSGPDDRRDVDGRRAAAATILPPVRLAYAAAAEALRLPLSGGFASCPRVVDVPFIARHARHSRHEVRRRLALPVERPLVLLSFGGYGLSRLDPSALDCLGDFTVVLTHGLGPGDRPPAGRGIAPIDERALYDAGLRYEDLVAAVDVVATKPGYGIISECIANDTAMLYTSRGRFAEYEVLVREIPRYLRVAFIDPSDLVAGRWKQALTRLLAQPAPPERPATDGANVVARRILQYV